MFTFNDSEWLSWIWIILVIFIFAILLNKIQTARFTKKLGKKSKFLLSSFSPVKQRWHLFLQCVVLTGFVLALARPVFGVRSQEIKQTGIELVVALCFKQHAL